MEMKHVGNAVSLLNKFPILKVIPQVKEILKDIDKIDLWILIQKGELYISKNETEEKNEQIQNTGRA